MTMAEIEDKIVKDVLMHGFKADERTCCEAKLRFLMQQKTSLIDQWRYTRTALLKELGRKLDQIDRKDIESLVQIPSGDDDALNEIDEDDYIEEEEEEEEDSSEEEILQIPENEVIEHSDEYQNDDILENAQFLNEKSSQLSPIKEENKTTSPTTDLPSYKSPVLTPVLNAVTNSESDLDKLKTRVENLEKYVKKEVEEIKNELLKLSV